jgi:signal transduction histidine kinase
MDNVSGSTLSLRLSAQILDQLARGEPIESTCHHLVQVVEAATPLAVVIVLVSSNKIASSRVGEISNELSQMLMQAASDNITAEQALAWWPNYQAAYTDRIQFKSTPIGYLILLAPDAALAPLFDDVKQPLQLGLQVVAAEISLVQRSNQLLANQNEFVRLVTHDLRSPLTAIHGFASMIEEGAAGQLNEKQRHYISKITIGTSQLAALIENIADAGRYDPETGFYEMLLVPTDPNEIVRKITSTYLIPTEKSDLRVEVKLDDDAPIIYADQNMLERAAINLLDNAVKYTPNGGYVTVSVFTDQQRLYIQVRDTGSGIKREDQRKLFQRHVRLRQPEHRQVRGAGLGLFLVKTVAVRHGGDAFVESELGKGSTFGIWIPLNEHTIVPL